MGWNSLWRTFLFSYSCSSKQWFLNFYSQRNIFWKKKKIGIILWKWFHPIVIGTKNVIDMHFAFYRCKNLHQRKWSVQGYCVTEWWSNILGHQPLFQNQLPEKFHSSKQLRSHYTRFVFSYFSSFPFLFNRCFLWYENIEIL